MKIVLVIIGSLCWYAAGFINGMLYENRRFKKEIQALKEWFDKEAEEINKKINENMEVDE